ncbi:MAG TPA: FecR domain-containing protein [Puia sp.]|nr:FecR domain-containing protein [Puia sp.]
MESPHDNKERIRLLLESRHWSEDDRRWLLAYLDGRDQEEMRQLMEADFFSDAATPQAHPEAERLLALIHAKIQPENRATPLSVSPGTDLNPDPPDPPSDPSPSTTPLFFLHGWRKWAVAALVLLIAGKTILYFLPANPKTNKPLASGTKVPAAHDLPPGRNTAVLTLADGHTITLDSAANGGLAQQGNTKVIKLNGQIAYTNTGRSGPAGGASAGDVILFNTISTARGNQYQLILSDGSKVWLNAASSLRFPTSFKGKERKVEVTGEAYFEIAKNPAMPFKVAVNGGEIDVLGTHFNVNAYNDESSVKTTLLEGAVKIKKDNATQMLSPGQQARFTSKGEMSLFKNVDVAQETAWKDGFFWFNNTDIYTLMRQVSRWYNVEVEFKGGITDDGFTGKVSRNVPLSKLLNVLEQYEIHFKVEEKKITVLP